MELVERDLEELDEQAARGVELGRERQPHHLQLGAVNVGPHVDVLRRAHLQVRDEQIVDDVLHLLHVGWAEKKRQASRPSRQEM